MWRINPNVRTCRYKRVSLKAGSITQPLHQAKLGNKVDVVIGLSQERTLGGVIRGLILGSYYWRYNLYI